MKSLRLILGDQLNAQHSWYQSDGADTLYLIAELSQETEYVKHHEQKLCAFFLAMQHFAEALTQAGKQVLYLMLDDTAEFADLTSLLAQLCREHQVTKFEYQRPDERRLFNQMRGLTIKGVSIEEFDTEHFLVPFDELGKHFKASKRHTMEAFYRRMRKQERVLMEGDEPEGGRWNFDAENRGVLTKEDLLALPEPLLFANDVSEIRERLERHQVPRFGNCIDQLLWPVNCQQALQLLDFFCETLLPNFGRFQDALTDQTPHAWSLYHSRLSFAINSKMLHPRQVIKAAVQAHHDRPDEIDLAQVEGFVRQILGWREFIRGIYWVNEDYGSLNALSAERPLPTWFWTGETQMNCMRQAVVQSLNTAYAHHIQRLMVTGNFALIAGLHPDAVDAWYLGIYIDAIEWVEQPNTRGMILFGDNGLVATKPYAASGNYINKQGDYCKSCAYSVKKRDTEDACPLNSLYWHFLNRHAGQFASNPRMRMPYRSWQRMNEDSQQRTLQRAEWVLEHLDEI